MSVSQTAISQAASVISAIYEATDRPGMLTAYDSARAYVRAQQDEGKINREEHAELDQDCAHASSYWEEFGAPIGSTLIKLPPVKLAEAVKLAGTNPAQAARLLCDWWNRESGCAPELRRAAIPLLWASENQGSTFSVVHYDGPLERPKLFTQSTWRSSVAHCGDSFIVVFLREPTSSDLDAQGVFHTYLVNGTVYESIGADFENYEPGVFVQFGQLAAKYPREYQALSESLIQDCRDGAAS